MQKKVTALIIMSLVILVVSTDLPLPNLATANFCFYLPYITINSDGSITPENVSISRHGSTYALTSNITMKYAVKIKCSNIVFDGAGLTIDGFLFNNNGLQLIDVTNVTVKNLSVKGFADTSIIVEGSNCTVENVNTTTLIMDANFSRVTECNLFELGPGSNNVINRNVIDCLFLGSNNIVTENNVTNLYFWMQGGGNNTFTKNNFWCKRNCFELWFNGTIGNYWGDYNGTDANNDGIGDTPYLIKMRVCDNNEINYVTISQDDYPLMKPYIVPTPSPTSELSMADVLTSTSSLGFLLPVLIVAILAVILLIYRKNSKH